MWLFKQILFALRKFFEPFQVLIYLFVCSLFRFGEILKAYVIWGRLNCTMFDFNVAVHWQSWETGRSLLPFLSISEFWMFLVHIRRRKRFLNQKHSLLLKDYVQKLKILKHWRIISFFFGFLKKTSFFSVKICFSVFSSSIEAKQI